MGQRGDRQRLALESRQAIGIGGKRLRQHLDGDVALQLGIARAVHVAHAARADVRSDLVGADDGSRLETHEGNRLYAPHFRAPPLAGSWTRPVLRRIRHSQETR